MLSWDETLASLGQPKSKPYVYETRFYTVEDEESGIKATLHSIIRFIEEKDHRDNKNESLLFSSTRERIADLHEKFIAPIITITIVYEYNTGDVFCLWCITGSEAFKVITDTEITLSEHKPEGIDNLIAAICLALDIKLLKVPNLVSLLNKYSRDDPELALQIIGG